MNGPSEFVVWKCEHGSSPRSIFATARDGRRFGLKISYQCCVCYQCAEDEKRCVTKHLSTLVLCVFAGSKCWWFNSFRCVNASEAQLDAIWLCRLLWNNSGAGRIATKHFQSKGTNSTVAIIGEQRKNNNNRELRKLWRPNPSYNRQQWLKNRS